MKRNSKLCTLILLCLSLFSFATVKSGKKQANEIRIKLGILQYSDAGIGLGLDKNCPSASPAGKAIWAIKLQNLSDPSKEVMIGSKNNLPEIESSENSFTLVYNQLQGESKSWDLTLRLYFTARDNAFRISGEIQNREKEWVVVGFTGPVINGIDGELASHPLLMPCGLGQKFIQAPSAGQPVEKVSFKGGLSWEYDKSSSSYELRAHYPSRFATMQWCALAGDNGGLYLGSHDNLCRSKKFRVRYFSENQTLGFAFEHELTCFSGESREIPSLVVFPYEGTWHKAASFYRDWYNTSIKLQEVPDWAKKASGWMLAILKQQNDEIMWDYRSLGELCRLSAERGLDIVGLFGWTQGGHDRFYPDYNPDPAMGGRDELMKGIGDIHKQGKQTIIYANGQLIDQNGTDYWGQQGKQITVVKKDGTYDYQKWHKYNDAPPRFHGMACLGCNAWYERMLSLAIQANELGADGILYDQLAVTAPKFCYAPNHGHPVPAVVYEGDRYRLLNRIADTMKTINPRFIIMTEGLCDAVLSSVSFFHGYENGAYVPTQEEITARQNGSAPTFIFPEMFRYTFPEILTTTRNPAPVNNRLILNYATVFGLRQELESRYAADVRYLKENRIPLPSDYSNVISKPDLSLVTSEDPVASLNYTRQIIDFQRENSDLLWLGKYSDELGFTLHSGSGIIAKAFVAGKKMGIVLWNTGTQEMEFSLDVPGYKLLSAKEPEKGDVNPYGKLPAEHIRLLIFEK